MNLLTTFKNYCQEELIINEGEKILLGVSGGPDSLTMLDLFSQIRDDFNLQLYVFHLNHMFRKEAGAEAEFVATVCREYDVKVYIKKIDVPAMAAEKGLSPEEAAREARFNFMKDKAEELDVKKIALAHNRDDNIETILFHIFRGSALKGLTGINPVTEYGDLQIIHPLLDISSYEIEKYCQGLDYKPRRDPSNKETVYVRNKIRHKIIPYIEEEINPGFKDVIVRMAGILKEDEEFLATQAAEEMEKALIDRFENRIVLSIDYMQNLSVVIRRRIIQQVINDLQGQIVDLYYEHLNTADEFIKSGNTGKKIDLPEEIILKRVYNRLIIKQGSFERKKYNYELQLNIPGEVRTPQNRTIKTEIINKSTDWLKLAVKSGICLCDYQKVGQPLYVRTRRNGDEFQPLGMQGMKKLKDYFIDEKINPRKRDKTPLIVDNKQRIIWITEMRMNDKFRVTDKTEEIVKISIT